jgi:hypothetical protein
MLSRYATDFSISITRDGKRYYQTNIPNVVPLDIFQFTITAQDGDRFDTLAALYYKDASKWWIIAKANNLLNGTMMVPGGTQLIIPSAGL